MLHKARPTPLSLLTAYRLRRRDLPLEWFMLETFFSSVRVRVIWRVLVCGSFTGALTSCASLPVHSDRVASHAIAGSTDTPLGRIAAASVPKSNGSGFRFIPNGAYAFDTRIELIERAQRSVDLQYYLLANDASGRDVLRALRDAAVRGVRVRLLLDDLYTAGETDLLQGLAAFPNVEIRLFNPFPGGRSSLAARFITSIFEISRLNHRMHNKLMIVDGAIAIVGGRNIADEYFNNSVLDNFVDNDLLIAGALVPHLADAFDVYWNSPPAYPLATLGGPSPIAPAARRRFEELTAGVTPAASSMPRADALGYGPIGRELDRGRIDLVAGLGFVYFDLPSKITSDDIKGLSSVSFDVASLMHAARSSLVICTPYFIPGERGMELITEDRARGVKINVLTNSLSSSDTLVTYIGYARYRRAVLAAGVDLYELSGKSFVRLKGFGEFRSSGGGLHAKQAVIDGTTVYIGSMNLDPRSRDENTEIGVIVESPQLSRELLKIIELAEFGGAYRLRFAPDGHSIEWLKTDGEKEQIYTYEPESDFIERLKIDLLSPFAPEELL